MEPNDPAFNDESYMSSGEHVHDMGFKNLTKREYFAAMAMNGILSNRLTIAKVTFKMIATHSVLQADALIKELSK